MAAGGSQSKRYDDDFDTLAKPREEAKVEKTDFGGRSAAGMLSAMRYSPMSELPLQLTIHFPYWGPLSSRRDPLHLSDWFRCRLDRGCAMSAALWRLEACWGSHSSAMLHYSILAHVPLRSHAYCCRGLLHPCARHCRPPTAQQHKCLPSCDAHIMTFLAEAACTRCACSCRRCGSHTGTHRGSEEGWPRARVPHRRCHPCKGGAHFLPSEATSGRRCNGSCGRRAGPKEAV